VADQSDVEVALVGQIQSILYPTSTTEVSAIGAICRVYRGWPLSASLNADLAAGIVNVSVLPIANSIKPLVSFNDGWLGGAVAPGMVATTFGNSVVFLGTAGIGQLAGLLVDGVPYVYSSVAGDTVLDVAAQLATMVAGNIAAISSGDTVTVPGAISVVGRAAADVGQWQEIRRQRQSFSIIFYCSTPQLRDAAVAWVDLGLAALRFVALADGSSGRVVFGDTVSQDQNQIASIYRRDLTYHVEYATTLSMTATEMMFGGLGLNGSTSYS